MTLQQSSELDTVFAAMADPTRRAIIEALSAGDETAGSLAARFPISRPAVARHIRVLRDSGIVVVRPRGRERVNSLNPRVLGPAMEWIEHMSRFWDDRLAKLRQAVEGEES